jgi:hypothetical protein
MWRRQRIWALLLIVVGAVMSVAMVVSQKGVFNSNAAVMLTYIPAGLLFGSLLLVYRRRSYAEVKDSGLRVSNLLRSVLIPYEAIRGTRVQLLGLHFQDTRKRYIRPVSRPLMQRPALFVRLRGDEDQLAALRRRLGSQLAAGDMVALPIPDPDAMAWEISARLPERTAVNLGGGRRRRRRGR